MATSTQTGFDAVTAALNDLSTAVNDETTQSDAAAAEILQLLNDARNAVSSAQWQQVADQIEAKVTQMKTNNSNLAAAVASAVPAPAPAQPAPTTPASDAPTA